MVALPTSILWSGFSSWGWSSRKIMWLISLFNSLLLKMMKEKGAWKFGFYEESRPQGTSLCCPSQKCRAKFCDLYIHSLQRSYRLSTWFSTLVPIVILNQRWISNPTVYQTAIFEKVQFWLIMGRGKIGACPNLGISGRDPAWVSAVFQSTLSN